MSYYYKLHPDEIPPGQLRLLGIIMQLRAENRPITFRLLARIEGCLVNSVHGQLVSMRAKGLVDWDLHSDGRGKNSTIRPCVRFIAAANLFSQPS